MNPVLLEDYIEIQEAEDFLDGRHKKLLELAKEELARQKDEAYEENQRTADEIFDLNKVDHDTALELNK